MENGNNLETDWKSLACLKLVLLIRSPFFGTGGMSAHFSSLGNPSTALKLFLTGPGKK